MDTSIWHTLLPGRRCRGEQLEHLCDGDHSGHISGQSSAGLLDAFVRKYDLAGIEQWTRQFGTLFDDRAYGVTADASGVYLGCSAEDPIFLEDYGFVRKYDTDGVEVWSHDIDVSNHDFAYDISANASGVYVVGSTSGTLPGQTSIGGGDAFIRKYDIGGVEQWTRQFGTANGDTALGVTTDDLGIYVAGYTYGAFPGEVNSGDTDVFVTRFDADGEEKWTQQFGTEHYDFTSGVVTDRDGAYIVGATMGAFQGFTNLALSSDVFVAKVHEFRPHNLTIDGPAEAFLGDEVEFTFVATGATPADQAGDFTYKIDWDGNGTIDDELVGPSTYVVAHAFPDAGSYSVQATALDQQGVEGNMATHDILVKIPVQIEIKPGSDDPSVNIGSNGLIAVAMFSTSEFNVETVNLDTVIFAGATVANSVYEDFDADGDLDLIMHFYTQETNLDEIYQDLLLNDLDLDGILDSTQQTALITLRCETNDGSTVEGSDELNLFLSGKKLRELLDQLFAEEVL